MDKRITPDFVIIGTSGCRIKVIRIELRTSSARIDPFEGHSIGALIDLSMLALICPSFS